MFTRELFDSCEEDSQVVREERITAGGSSVGKIIESCTVRSCDELPTSVSEGGREELEGDVTTQLLTP